MVLIITDLKGIRVWSGRPGYQQRSVQTSRLASVLVDFDEDVRYLFRVIKGGLKVLLVDLWS